METRYTAFISYKHAPADIAVASEIQKRLERYHIPAPIRKKIGREKIGRIFRDKEELPITSDLSDDISRALEEADYLIVICSTSTKLSTWVPREIAYFLRNHSKKQVLTVLVDGEPNEVIPKELLTDTAVRQAPDGTAFEEEIIYEPLSCDFRGSIKEARRTEIPRLAAALLGCSYDELVMRERQYKRRRAMAIGIPAVCALAVAVGYLIWSRQEIAKNYEQAQANLTQALINQSEYLCTQSNDYLESGDRMRALLLALEALPSQDNDRPLTSTAIRQLGLALHAYIPISERNSDTDTTTVAEFAVQGNVEKFIATNDGRYLIVRDSYESAYVWDLVTYDLILTAGSRAPKEINGIDITSVRRVLEDANIVDVRLVSDTTIGLLTDKSLSVWDLSSDGMAWTYEDKDVNWSMSAFIATYDDKEIFAAVSSENGSGDYEITMLALDAESGALLNRSKAVPAAASTEKADFVRVSPDHKYAAAVLGRQGFDQRLLVWQRETGALTPVVPDEALSEIQSVTFSEDDKLAVVGWPAEPDEEAYYSEVVTLTINKAVKVAVLDPETLEAVWENSFFSPQIQKLEKGKGLYVFDEPGLVVCCYANKTAVFNYADGSLYDEVESTSTLIDVNVSIDGNVVFFTENGSIGVYDYREKGKALMNQFFEYGIAGMRSINRYGTGTTSMIIQPDSSRLWLCEEVYDEDFERFSAEPLPKGFSRRTCAVTDHAVFIAGSDGGVHIYDPDDQKPVLRLNLNEDDLNYTYLGKDPAEDRLWFYGYSLYSEPDYLISVTADGGDIRRFVLRENCSMEAACGWLNGFYAAIADKIEEHILDDSVTICTSGRALPKKIGDGRFAWTDGEILNIGHAEGEALVVEKSFETGLTAGRIFVSPDGRKALICDLGETNEIEKLTGTGSGGKEGLVRQNRIVDLETGELTDVSLSLHGFPMGAYWNEDGACAAVTDGEELELWSAEGALMHRFGQAGHLIVSAALHDGELIILFSEGNLTRYDLANGHTKGQSFIMHYPKYTQVGESVLTSDGFSDQVSWEFSDDRLYLTRSDTFCALHIIDLSDWEEELGSDKLYAHDAARERLISWETDPETGILYPGWFRHYTVEELREKAVKDLHGMILTDEELEMFGLGVRPVSEETSGS